MADPINFTPSPVTDKDIDRADELARLFYERDVSTLADLAAEKPYELEDLAGYGIDLVAEVRRLRGLLADLASDHMRISTERMHAVGEAVSAMEDVLATSHLTKPMRQKALTSLKELRRVFNAESKSPPASIVENNERIRAKEVGGG